MQGRAGPDAYVLHDRHGLDHRDVQGANSIRGQVHDRARHRGGRLRQEHGNPAVLKGFEQVSDLPAILDVDQCQACSNHPRLPQPACSRSSCAGASGVCGSAWERCSRCCWRFRSSSFGWSPPRNAGFLAATLPSIPADWTNLRSNWEMGHAIRFALQFAALALLVLSLALDADTTSSHNKDA